MTSLVRISRSMGTEDGRPPLSFAFRIRWGRMIHRCVSRSMGGVASEP